VSTSGFLRHPVSNSLSATSLIIITTYEQRHIFVITLPLPACSFLLCVRYEHDEHEQLFPALRPMADGPVDNVMIYREMSFTSVELRSPLN